LGKKAARRSEADSFGAAGAGYDRDLICKSLQLSSLRCESSQIFGQKEKAGTALANARGILLL
jgi:hypothetical protein